MTRSEAIKVLENPDVSIGVSARIGQAPEYWRKLRPALDMAISAIRQQDVADKYVGKNEPLTNAQKIRAMTDEDLVNFLMRLMGHAQCFAEGIFPYHPCPQEQNCKQCGLDWLQQPSREEGKHEALD